MRDPFGPPLPQRSVSQFNQYHRCPYSYYLARVKREWQRPAAWLPQGTAVHYAAEWWERGGRNASLAEMLEVFEASYREEVASYLSITPNLDYWSASGRYRGQKDIERRLIIGREQTEKYFRYYTQTAPREVIWVAPDGTPGIEMAFNIELDEVAVRGYIDAIISRPLDIPRGDTRDEIVVRDNKTGNNPGDDFQLAVYAVAVADTYGVDQPRLGDYWMGRAGKPTLPFDLTKWPRQRVVDKFSELEENLKREDFTPKPDPDKCKFCDVSLRCEYKA